MPHRLAILASHPVQYNSPVFRLLAKHKDIELRVFYGWEGATSSSQADAGFGQKFQWDIPLLDGYDHEVLTNDGPTDVSHFKGLSSPDAIERITKWQPDALLVYGWSYRTHLNCLRHFSGRLKIFFRGDSTLLDERPGWRKLARRIYLRRIYRHVDYALCVGSHNRDYFLTHGLTESQLLDAPHSIENERFADPDGIHEAAAREWLDKLGISNGERTFLFAGKFEPKKAPLDLLNAFSKLESGHLLLAGSGELEEAMRAVSSERVHYLGFQNQSQMPVVYRLGDVVILPSQGPGETWGLALNEAMACSRAVIGSDRCGGAADLIAPGENGEIFEAGNVGRLSSAMNRFVRGESDPARMGCRSRDRIEGWSNQRQVEAVIEGLAR